MLLWSKSIKNTLNNLISIKIHTNQSAGLSGQSNSPNEQFNHVIIHVVQTIGVDISLVFLCDSAEY